MTNLYYDIFETRLGWIGLLASGKGLRRTTLPQANPTECMALLGKEAEKATPSPERFDRLRNKLEQYFQGGPATFDQEPLDIDGATPFFRAAWDACRSIPIGETRSYGWLAAQAGRPNTPRAAGQSMARNRLPIIVPCHRVVASDGGLRGFGRDASQLGLKQQLLDLEATVV